MSKKQEEPKQLITSVALDTVSDTALNELMTRTGHNKSQVVRECILICYYLNISTDFLTLGKQAKELASGKHTPRTKNKITPEERRVLDAYIKTYSYKKKLYYPPILAALRTAAKGLSYDQLVEAVECSPTHWTAKGDMAKGNIPPLQALLSEKSLGMLVPHAEQMKMDEDTRAQLELEGTIKPLALADLRSMMDGNEYSAIYDMISQAASATEVAYLRKIATDRKLDALLEEIKAYGEL